MYPRLFELGPITVYTYGVLLAAAYLFGLQLARVRAQARGLDANRILDLGIYIIISALIGAKLLLLVTDFRTFTANPRELLTLARSGGVFYGGLILAVAVASVLHPQDRPAALDDVRRVRAGHRARARGRPLRVPVRRLLLRQTNDAAVGHHLQGSVCGGERRHAARRSAASDAAVRGRRGLLILIVLLATERKGRPYPGRTFWLYMLLYAISRFIIEFFRGDERGVVGVFSTSQFISVLLAPLAIVMLVYLSRVVAPEPKRARKAA